MRVDAYRNETTARISMSPHHDQCRRTGICIKGVGLLVVQQASTDLLFDHLTGDIVGRETGWPISAGRRYRVPIRTLTSLFHATAVELRRVVPTCVCSGR
jgi:hypothetical protein